MKISVNPRNYLLLSMPFLLLQLSTEAQVANWTFDNTLAGTGSANTVVTNAVLGSGIDPATSGYNGGTVYYGGDGWPAGGLDPNAYLEFSVAPTAAHTMTLSFLSLNIRRSTTGTAAGSGPTVWSLRSSLDGYASDISSATLTLTSTPTVTFALPLAFMNLAAKTTFRLYGYSSVVTTGGLNRFVYDNISITGSTVLPVTLQSFHAANTNGDVQLSWQLSGEGNISALNVQRSSNGTDFYAIGRLSVGVASEQTYSYEDHLNPGDNGDYFYRIQLISGDGQTSYSPVQKISLSGSGDFAIRAAHGNAGGSVQFTLTTKEADQYYFYLYSLNGTEVAARAMVLSEGSQLVTLDDRQANPGIYVLVARHANRQICTKLLIQ